MTLTPWYKVATPREDLRRRQPLDAAQFAVHLDKVAAGQAPPEYQDAERFFARTLLTDGLRRFAGEVMRRLAGERQGANAVLNLTTEFGGGKTHALTLLYHLAHLGPDASKLPGVTEFLDEIRLGQVPRAAVAVFVGTAWPVEGVPGGGTEPARLTPWGEIAWQLARQTGDRSLFEAVEKQDQSRTRPDKTTIRKLLPKDRPALILMDEVMNFMTGARAAPVGKSTLASQFYSFVQNLTEEADSADRFGVVVSLPASELEMAAEDEQDFRRLAKVTTRVAEPYKLAKGDEIAEIIRRRLFDSVGEASQIRATARAYARWVQDHRDQLPLWFPIDRAPEAFEATYPFHPTVISVFERKWQALPSFQRTRGILRLLAQWVADAYEDGYKGAHHDALVALGTAPLDDQFFRAAVLDQLGTDQLAAAILSDIAGDQAHAERRDADATETLRRYRIHRKVATTVFFESSGGQQRQEATLPEVRLAVGEPDLDIGNVETALEALQESCYYLAWEGNRYRFSAKPNLNQILADRRAALDGASVDEAARQAIRKVFGDRKGVATAIEPVFFPEHSTEVDDIPALRLIVLAPDRTAGEETRALVSGLFSERGASARQFRNGLIFLIPDSLAGLLDAARRRLAWESIEDEADQREFSETERRQIAQQKERAARDLSEAVWRTYRFIAFMGSDGELKEEDLGVLHSSAAESMQALVQARLRQRDEITDSLAPTRIAQNWPKGLTEWTTKAVRDAVYASPVFTRLLRADALKDSIARGVRDGLFGYAAKRNGEYVGIKFNEPLDAGGVEFSADVVLVPESLARQLKDAQPTPEVPVPAEQPRPSEAISPGEGEAQPSIFTSEKIPAVRWKGEVPHQKWTTFYTKVLQRLVPEGGLTVHVEFDARPPGGINVERAEETKQGLRELGLSEELSTDTSGHMD